MLKIYGHARSRAFRAVWLCRELDIPYENVDVTSGVDSPECTEEWYLGINPDGTIPAIDDDGFVLWDASAILIYLARKRPERLWPGTVQAEGRMLQWAFFAASEIEPPMNTLYEHRIGLPTHRRNPALADDCGRRLMAKLRILERHLETTPYFGGIRWDLSDFMIASTLYTVYEMKTDLVRVPKVDRWLRRSVQRNAAREAIALRS